MSTVIITGGTGMIGTVLTSNLLSQGFEVIILSRSAVSQQKSSGNSHPGLSYAHWDPAKKQVDASAISRASHIVHLAGAGVADRRWTKKRKEQIRRSRVDGGELISSALAKLPNQVSSVVCASGIGWYGPDPAPGGRPSFVESDPAHTDFLGETCRQWEASSLGAASAGKRVVILRTGIVLSNAGGALPRFRTPMKFGVAPVLGKGTQVMSWIHIEDLVGIYQRALTDAGMKGVYNAVSPSPVTNREFVSLLKKSSGSRAVSVRVPSLALKAVLGEMSIEVLKSATVSANRLIASGYAFRFPDLPSALKELEG